MIVVPPPPPPSSSVGPAAVAAILPLTDAPALLRSVPLGAILQGTIAANSPGALVVQTAQGQISLAVTLAGLKVGQPVTLTLQPGSGNGGQVLIQADRPATPGVATVSDLLPNIQSGAQPARPGAVVQATVIRAGGPQPGEPPLQNGPAPAPVGAAPASTPAPGAPSAAAATPAVAAPASLLPTPPGAAPTPAAAPPTGQPLAQPPGQPTNAASPQAPTTAAQAPTASPAPPGAPPPQTPTAATATGQTASPQAQPAPPTATPTPSVNQQVAAPTTGSPAPSATPAAPSPAAAAPTPGATISAPPPPAAGTTVSSAAATPQAAPATRADAAQTPGFLLGANNGDRVPVRVVALLPAGSTAIPAPSAANGNAAAAPAAPLATASPTVATPGGSLASTPLAPGNFVGVVVGASANGSAIVQAGAGLMTLEGVSAPANSALILAPATVRGQAPPPPAPVNNAALAAALPGVTELINAANATGGPAQAAIQAILPRLGPQMAAGMVFFMRALRTGDLNEWLGKDARTAIERSGRAGSVKKAAAELEQVARANENAGEWSSYPIPVGVGGQRVEPIRLFVRQAEEDGAQGGSKGGKEKPTRFLIDVTLSRLGRIQLDGLARLPKLDLVLRSETPLNPAIQQPLRRFFADVTSARGIQGEMNFQVAPPIDPTVATPPKARPGIMV